MVLVVILSLLLISSTIGYLDTPLAERDDYIHILIVSSYARDFAHTRDAEKGIVETLNSKYNHIIFRYEYLDSKNYTDQIFRDMQAKIYREKYSKTPIDLIITVDNNALTLIKEIKDDIFEGDIPVIATGLNGMDAVINEDPEFYDKNPFYLIAELPDYKRGLELAINQSKVKPTDIYVIGDQTETTLKIYDEIMADFSAFNAYNLHVIKDKSVEELKVLVSNAKPTDLLFYVLYFKGPNGESYTYNYALDELTAVSALPIYVFWEFFLDSDTVGGYVLSSEHIGSKAAELAIRYFDHQKISKINYETGENIFYVFNYQILQKYNISFIPANSTVLNKPISYFEKNRDLIIVMAVVTAVLVIIILLLMFLLKEKNQINDYLHDLNALNEEFIETQRIFISTLGEVIETRSKETANHVIRVAKMSRLLAELAGLSVESQVEIEMVSPLHDIGKISIPDSILNKPGKLTVEEFEIIKLHTIVGYNLLKNTERQLMHMAAVIAKEHHEKWDGSGYPYGLKGNEIHIYAQITSICDVYDALLHRRVYKDPWPIEEVIKYLEDQSGISFSPYLIQLFIKNKDAFFKIALKYEDIEESIYADLN